MSAIRIRRFARPGLWSVTLAVSIPAVAGADWGENWGQMVWGGTASLPALAPVALVALGVSIVAVGARWANRRRGEDRSDSR